MIGIIVFYREGTSSCLGMSDKLVAEQVYNSFILLMISISSSHRLQPSTVGGIFRLTGAIVDDCRMDLDLQCYSLLNKTPVIIPHYPPHGLLVSGSVSKQELDEYQGMIMVPY